MITLSNAYLFCLVLGFTFTVGGAILGGLLGGGGHDVDAGGDGPDFSHDYDAGGHSGGEGHGDVSDSNAAGLLHLPLLSPTVISFFVATFGGSGMLYQRLFGLERAWLHVPLALGTACSAAVLIAWVIFKITRSLDSNRIARASDALQALAEVTVTVPVEGLGEVAYISGGTRQLMSARSHDGREHKQGASVKVVKLGEGVAAVAEATWPGVGPALGEGMGPLRAGGVSPGEPVRNPERVE